MADKISDELFSVLVMTSTENNEQRKCFISDSQEKLELENESKKQKVESSFASNSGIATHQSVKKNNTMSSRSEKSGSWKSHSVKSVTHSFMGCETQSRNRGKELRIHGDFFGKTLSEYDFRTVAGEGTKQRKRYRSSSQEKFDLRNKIRKKKAEHISVLDYDTDSPESEKKYDKISSHSERCGAWRSHSMKSNKYYFMTNGTQTRNRQKEFPSPGTFFAKMPHEHDFRGKASTSTVMQKGLQKFVPDTDNVFIGYNKQNSFHRCHYKGLSDNLNKGSITRLDRGKTSFRETQETNQRIKGSGFKFLEKLLNEEPNEVVIRLASPKTGFDEFLKKEMFPDLIYLVLRVIAEKVCVAGFHHNKISVLVVACQTSFLDTLSKHVIDLLTEESQSRISKLLQFLENLLTFYETVLNLLPSIAREKFKKIFIKTELSILGVKTYHNINSDLIKKKFDDLSAQLKHQIEQHESDSVKGSSGKEHLKHLMPPDNFRNCNIFPTIEDFTEKPFLRPSIVKGAYTDVNHYLDVQFRLLREDFIGPLRKGIAQYVEYSEAGSKGFKKIDNIKIYHDVRFIKPVTIKDKVGLLLNFDPNKKLRKVQWEYSKRFMFGSLLCFTADNFGNFFFGTVIDKNKNMLENGHISVQLYNKVDTDLFDTNFTMAESEIYFEPYRQVLKALQSLPPTEFPMKPYIVDGLTYVGPPQYLNRNPSIETYNIGHFKVPIAVMDTLDSLPSADDLRLDSSQHSSFQNALTKEFVIIQGPPGTGKTFLGLKIIETLLANQNLWKYDVRQILIVCYTNHALDQVLEGILKFTKNLIRVGGQSRSEVLAKFNLSEARKNWLYGKSTTSSRETFQKMQSVHNKIHSLQKQMDSISENNRIISTQTLKHIGISSEHLKCFMDRFIDSDELFVEWLTESTDLSVCDDNFGLPSVSSAHHSGNVSKCEQGGRVEEGNEEEDDDEENHMRKAWLEEPYEIDLSKVNNDDVHYALDLKSLLAKMEYIAVQMEFFKHDWVKYHGLQQEWIYHNSRYRFLKQQLSQRVEVGGHVIEDLLRVNSLWDLNITQRWILYNHWCSVLHRRLLRKECQLREEYKSLCMKFDEIRDMQDLHVMKEALIIGMTTSGAARKQSLLRELKPRIVLVEEAAEVLESHVVVSLTKECEHLILIGDHKQLRPSTAVYELARNFNFDISLFERMLKNGMNYACLEVQHRMRPEIVKLITPTIYPSLKNAQSVYQYPNVKGVSKNLYFIDHKFHEEKVAETVSHRNLHEAEFILAFCRYLLLQGYSDSEITILTTYSGQMYYMKRLKKETESLGNVRITILDNFQGEENRIILLSLVRSNEEGNIGFLKVENRICVALSRAREGLFIIGNMQNLVSGSSMWSKIKEILVEQESFGSELTLRCHVHPSQETKVATAADFKAVPEGGCSLLCEAELKCGHKCQSICHVLNRAHENYKCYFPCERIPQNCPLSHICPKKCFQNCERCETTLEKELPCKHVKTLPCHIDVNSYKCLESVEVELKICGHMNKKLCHQDEKSVNCQFPCKDRLPCGHSCRRRCHPGYDPDHIEYKCFKPCEKKNVRCKRDHRCHKRCFEDCGECKEEVTVKLECGHTHKLPCSTDPSTIKCKIFCMRTMSCGHKRRLFCCQPSGDCPVKVKKVIPDCKHTVVVACSKTPTQDICRKLCERFLPCKHQCKRLCGSTCTSECEELVPSNVRPACGHAVEIPCYLQGKELPPHSADLLLRCNMPCGITLECGHLCRGTCGACLQGRIHMPCKEKCERVLICGHSCKVDCAKNCPPCSQKCEYSCEHSRCSARCGFPCVPCVEQCRWRCKHSQCTKLCHEICNRDLCYEACDKKLQCGHACVGFCGEPCPPLCRICNKEELTSIFLGYEDEENARFVYLEDCKHVIESKGLDKWLTQTDSEISLKSCPRCKTDIKRTLRFINHLKTVYTDIINIKKKVFGNFKIIQEKRGNLLTTLKELVIPDVLRRENPYIVGLVLELKGNLKLEKKGKRNFLSLTDIESLSIKVDILTNLIGIVNIFEEHLSTQFYSKLKEHFDLLLNFFIKRNVHMSNQEVLDFNLEINRFMKIAQLYKIESSLEFTQCVTDKTVIELNESAWQIANSIERYTNFQDKKLNKILENLHKQLEMASENFENIKRQVVKAVGFSPGHWFKCPKGHYFVIGECGGAMEVGKCPDCGSLVGGRSHQLLPDNQHAGDIDGSAAPAYPTLLRN